MTFRESRLSLQLMAEERIGAPRYWEARTKREAEDRAFAGATGGANGVR